MVDTGELLLYMLPGNEDNIRWYNNNSTFIPKSVFQFVFQQPTLLAVTTTADPSLLVQTACNMCS